MPDLPYIRKKTLEGMMIQTGIARINLVPDKKILPGYAVTQTGNMVFINPETFQLLKEAESQEELLSIMKGLRVV